MRTCAYEVLITVRSPVERASRTCPHISWRSSSPRR